MGVGGSFRPRTMFPVPRMQMGQTLMAQFWGSGDAPKEAIISKSSTTTAPFIIASPALAGRFFTTEPPGKPILLLVPYFYNLPLSSIQSLSRVQLFETPWTAARQASLSITDSRSSPKLMSIELVMPSDYLILCHPFSSCLQSFLAPGSFPMNQFFESGGQSIGVSASASVLPKNTQD